MPYRTALIQAYERIDTLEEALGEAIAEIAYWLPDYLEGGKYHEHPRGSGPDRVTKLGRAALNKEVTSSNDPR